MKNSNEKIVYKASILVHLPLLIGSSLTLPCVVCGFVFLIADFPVNCSFDSIVLLFLLFGVLGFTYYSIIIFFIRLFSLKISIESGIISVTGKYLEYVNINKKRIRIAGIIQVNAASIEEVQYYERSLLSARTNNIGYLIRTVDKSIELPYLSRDKEFIVQLSKIGIPVDRK